MWQQQKCGSKGAHGMPGKERVARIRADNCFYCLEAQVGDWRLLHPPAPGLRNTWLNDGKGSAMEGTWSLG